MKYAVIGSRTFDNYELMRTELDKYDMTVIVSGGAKGADKLSEQYASERNIKTEIYKPDWTLGKHAGFLRNKTIVDNSDVVVAFWDGISKGTKNSIDYATKTGKDVIIIGYN